MILYLETRDGAKIATEDLDQFSEPPLYIIFKNQVYKRWTQSWVEETGESMSATYRPAYKTEEVLIWEDQWDTDTAAE